MELMTIDAWPDDRRRAFERGVRSAGWTKAHAARVRRSLELWFGFTGDAPTAEGLLAFQDALTEAFSHRTAATYRQGAMQGLSILSPSAPWAAIHLSVRGGKPVRTAPAPADPPDPTRDWPVEWRRRWNEARASHEHPRRYAFLFGKKDGPAARWSDAYARRVAGGLSRFLRSTTLTALGDGDAVKAYLASLAGSAPTSMARWIEDLAIGLPIVDPDGEHEWLADAASAAKRAAEARDKSPRMVTQDTLLDLGRRLRREADAMPFGPHAAIRFRDGFMISLLTKRPVRLRNFHELQIGGSLGAVGDLFTMTFETTKNGAAWSASVPADLRPAMDRWLSRYRPLLVDRDTDDGAVWIGLDGRAITPGAISRRVGDITERRLGRRVSPHLMRSIYATDLTAIDPDNVQIASAVLGQRDARTINRHYRQGQMRQAAVLLDEALEAYRMPHRRIRTR